MASTHLCVDLVVEDIDAHDQVQLGTDSEQAAALLHLGVGRRGMQGGQRDVVSVEYLGPQAPHSCSPYLNWVQES